MNNYKKMGALRMNKQTLSKFIQAFTKWTTPIIAVLGLALSIINTHAMLQKDKVKLEILPLAYVHINQNICLTTNAADFYSLPIKDQELIKTSGILAFTIINKSAFPVEISDTGITIEKYLASNRIFIQRPFIIYAPEHLSYKIDSYTLYPVRLGSRESITLLMPDHEENSMAFDGHKYIYVHTMCGETFYSNASKILNILNSSKQ